jgi:hypothetical protein
MWRLSPLGTWCHSVRRWQSGDRLQPLPYADLFHEPRQKVLVHHREFGRSRTWNRSLCAGDPVQCHQASFTPATSCMYAPLPPSRFKTFLMRMPNGKPELGSSWISLSKLVSRRESHTSTCGCTLSLGSRDKNSGPSAAWMSQITTSHLAAHPNLLAWLITHSHHSTSSCHTRFICSSDSLTIYTRVNN